ncbi:MAG: tRNA pseudouridine(55) synthase TruB [Bacteroidia bacterium]
MNFKMDFQKGELLLINKPYQWTSFDVVNKVRNILKKIPTEDSTTSGLKVGHAGTLDPLATGLLIICTGRLTKEIDTYQAQEKEYSGSFYLGATTPSHDLETSIDHQFDSSHITDELIFETTKKFQGKIFQIPPSYSAIKINGQRAYEKARKGKEIKLEPREIFMKEFEITQIEMPLVHFRIVCSKGTYIRSVANDFGIALNSGAYLASLCRTRIGNFKLEDAMSIEEFVEKFQIAIV